MSSFMTSEHGTTCQVGLALPTRKISIEERASPVLSAWGCKGVIDGGKEKVVPNPVQKVSFVFFFLFFPLY